MKKLLLSLFALGAMSASAQHLYGDLDHDGLITVADEILLRNIILGNAEAEEIQIEDLLPKTYTINGVEYPMPEAVDLGLPSGTKWASLIIGQKNSEDEPLRFMWGSSDINCENYPYKEQCTAEDGWPYTKYTKYNKTHQELCEEDDAATYYLGRGWKTPSLEDWYELFKCDRVTDDELYFTRENYYTFVGKNGNSISIKSNFQSFMTSILHEPVEIDSYYGDHYDSFVGITLWEMFPDDNTFTMNDYEEFFIEKDRVYIIAVKKE